MTRYQIRAASENLQDEASGFESGERYLRTPRPFSAEFLVSVA